MNPYFSEKSSDKDTYWPLSKQSVTGFYSALDNYKKFSVFI